MVLTVSVTYTATKVAVMERMEKLHIERTLTTDLSLFGLPAPTPHTICFLREHNRVNFTWQATATVLDSVLCVFSWDTAFHLKAGPEIDLLKENCAIAHIALEQKTESVASSGASPRAYSQPGETTSIVAQLTHEYWNTRRDIANAAARGGRVEQRLTELGGHMNLNSQGAMTGAHVLVPRRAAF
ncbi:hypothetical protein C8F01DRAFT_1194860 [Mycena amicta]|nr:hypothetical protein C8F01DRAFT_1194860 [Mycena amicta]